MPRREGTFPSNPGPLNPEIRGTLTATEAGLALTAGTSNEKAARFWRRLGAEVLEYPVHESDAIVGLNVNQLQLPREALVSVLEREGEALHSRKLRSFDEPPFR